MFDHVVDVHALPFVFLRSSAVLNQGCRSHNWNLDCMILTMIFGIIYFVWVVNELILQVLMSRNHPGPLR